LPTTLTPYQPCGSVGALCCSSSPPASICEPP
jgi:hypothetical protein